MVALSAFADFSSRTLFPWDVIESLSSETLFPSPAGADDASDGRVMPGFQSLPTLDLKSAFRASNTLTAASTWSLGALSPLSLRTMSPWATIWLLRSAAPDEHGVDGGDFSAALPFLLEATSFWLVSLCLDPPLGISFWCPSGILIRTQGLLLPMFGLTGR